MLIFHNISVSFLLINLLKLINFKLIKTKINQKR